jgi:hypothetical protein
MGTAGAAGGAGTAGGLAAVTASGLGTVTAVAASGLAAVAASRLTSGAAGGTVVTMTAGRLGTRTTGGTASGATGVGRTIGGTASGAMGVGSTAGVCGAPGRDVVVILAPLIILVLVILFLVAPLGVVLGSGLGLHDLGEAAGEGTAALDRGDGIGTGSDGNEVGAAVGGLGEMDGLVVEVEDGVNRLQEGVTEDGGGCNCQSLSQQQNAVLLTTLESAEDAELGAGDVDDKVRDGDADDLVGKGEVDGARAAAAVDAVEAGGGVELSGGERLEKGGEDGGRERAQRRAAVEQDGLAGAGVDLGGGTTGLGDGDLVELDKPPSLAVRAGNDGQLGQVAGILLGIDTTEDDGAWTCVSHM